MRTPSSEFHRVLQPIIIISFFQRLGLLACSGSEFIFLKLMYLFGQLVGLLGGGISPTQGLYLNRTTQHRKTRTHIHASSGIRIHDPSFRAAEDGTCLIPLSHWDRLQPTTNVSVLWKPLFIATTVAWFYTAVAVPSFCNITTNRCQSEKYG
jgi:hypothetical protein